MNIPVGATAALLLLLSPIALPAQQGNEVDELTVRLREVANRRTMTEAEAAQRRSDADAWLQTTPDVEGRGLDMLRTIARCLATDPALRQQGADELVAWFNTHDTLPVTGFDEPVGRTVLLDVVHRADAGKWDECERLLPVLLRASADHSSTFWLLGRRARDADTDDGRRFLQRVVIPALLADHGMDDADRVHILRLLYAVEYTGPRPFTHVAGPGLGGDQVRTADHAGRVMLVDYWATWCRPCLIAMPGVVAAHRRFHDQGLAVIGISIDDADRRQTVLDKVRELGIEFPIVFDGKGWESELATTNRVQAIPATFLIDRKGRVRYTGLEGDELNRRIAELLAEK